MRSASRPSFALAVLLAAATLVAPHIAHAEPGQTLAQFRAWSHGKKLLAGIKETTDELSAKPAFTLNTADHGIAWIFNAVTNGTTVQYEMLAVSEPGKAVGSAPIRHDGTGYGFTFFQSLYGRTVADDFKNAKLVHTIVDRTNGATTGYYRGSLFWYEQGGSSLTVETAAEFALRLRMAEHCNAHPDECSE